MIGERHQTNASDITVDLLRLAKADGKKTNAFIELSELDFGDAIKDLNATSPESLLKDDVRNKIYDKMVSSYCASLNKLSGKEGFFNSSKLNELAKTDVSTKMRLEQFENIILMRYFGASIKLVDPYSIYAISSNGKNINYNTREDGIYKLVSGSVADDCLNICVVGAGHASKFKTEVLHGGVEKPLGMQLDAAYGAKNVAHISIFPDLAKISKRDPGQLAAYSELAPPTSPTAKQSPAGKSKPADYDMFLYHDWRE